MLTLATDQTFEFLFAVAQVSKMVLLEKWLPPGRLRMVRILNAAGDAMSSLILDSPRRPWHGAKGWCQIRKIQL
jgi:hypothetical protein